MSDAQSDDVRWYRRCENGVACPEVIDRVTAAERARDLLDVPPDHPAVLQLRENARRIAEAHRYGQGGDTR